MTAGRFIATAALCTLLTGAAFAQVTGQTIQERKADQQGRIAQGVRTGQLTRGETRNLERREASVNREEHAMRLVVAGARCKKESSSGDWGRSSGGEPIRSVSNVPSVAATVSISMPKEFRMRPPIVETAWTS